jgi:hypothetical protein
MILSACLTVFPLENSKATDSSEITKKYKKEITVSIYAVRLKPRLQNKILRVEVWMSFDNSRHYCKNYQVNYHHKCSIVGDYRHGTELLFPRWKGVASEGETVGLVILTSTPAALMFARYQMSYPSWYLTVSDTSAGDLVMSISDMWRKCNEWQ